MLIAFSCSSAFLLLLVLIPYRSDCPSIRGLITLPIFVSLPTACAHIALEDIGTIIIRANIYVDGNIS